MKPCLWVSTRNALRWINFTGTTRQQLHHLPCSLLAPCPPLCPHRSPSFATQSMQKLTFLLLFPPGFSHSGWLEEQSGEQQDLSLVQLLQCGGRSHQSKWGSTVGPLKTLPAWPGCYHVVLLWKCGAVDVPAGPLRHPMAYYHKEVAGTPWQRANSPSAILGDEFRIVGIRHKGRVSQCSLHLLQLNDKNCL